MSSASWLDTLLHRFQDRWETNAQYRAAASGVLGLIVMITLCSCTGLLSVAASGALSSLGFGAGSSNASQGGNLNTGTNQITGYKTFAVPTPPTVSSSGIPAASPIPNSQTPAPIPTPTPTPTAAPTATPCQTGCGGGGGGGGGIAWSGGASPSPWLSTPGSQNYVTVHSSKPSIGFGFIVTIPNGSTQTYEPAGITDGNGDGSWLYPQACSPGVYIFRLMGQFSSHAQFNITCV